MSLGTLLTIFGFLACRPRTMGTGDILLLLCFCLYLSFVRVFFIATLAEVYSTYKNILEIIHSVVYLRTVIPDDLGNFTF